MTSLLLLLLLLMLLLLLLPLLLLLLLLLRGDARSGGNHARGRAEPGEGSGREPGFVNLRAGTAKSDVSSPLKSARWSFPD